MRLAGMLFLGIAWLVASAPAAAAVQEPVPPRVVEPLEPPPVVQERARGRMPSGRLAPGLGAGMDPEEFNVPYDGSFTFVRIRFTPASEGFGRRDLKWDHDYPRAERNFGQIVDALTEVEQNLAGSNILAMDDPELFKYPVAYLAEPGFWTMTPSEEENLRQYLLKGGLLILDDFAGGHWYNTEVQIRTLIPDATLVQLDPAHPIFDSFFHIESLDYQHPYYGMQSYFIAVFEDNDPQGRPMIIANYNNDIGEYWEWSDTGFVPIDLSNEAYKLGINYLVYAMTH
jgi:hypothetical protein